MTPEKLLQQTLLIILANWQLLQSLRWIFQLPYVSTHGSTGHCLVPMLLSWSYMRV